MNTKALFVAILEDETVFVGGKSYEKTLWLDIPNKKIKRLFYSLPDGDHLCLSLYDRYFHFVEAVTDISGKNSGTVNLEHAYILGEKEGKVICYKINLKQKIDKNIGNIERIEYTTNDPFILGLNKKGWR